MQDKILDLLSKVLNLNENIKSQIFFFEKDINVVVSCIENYEEKEITE